jgi:hypothetical protein
METGVVLILTGNCSGHVSENLKYRTHAVGLARTAEPLTVVDETGSTEQVCGGFLNQFLGRRPATNRR